MMAAFVSDCCDEECHARHRESERGNAEGGNIHGSAQIAVFQQETSPDAYEKVVDRLLNSPQYGERWAQHWLDVVRFAETEGFEYDRHLPDAWRFRDYVIQSLNSAVAGVSGWKIPWTAVAGGLESSAEACN